MSCNPTEEERKEALKIGLIGIMLFAIVILSCIICNQRRIIKELREVSQTTSPVEESRIDSLNKANTKLIIEVEFLDSIKDVEKDKVLTLNNDSTLRLFYELLRKE